MNDTEGGLKGQLASLQATARERTVKTQTIEYDLETLVKKITRDVIRLDPDYQRRHRWTPETSSRLIESLILNIPIPLIYISQDIDADTESGDEEARYSVIDGQQRLTAIKEFMAGEYPLVELEVLKELNGLTYKQLPPFLIRRLEERTVRCLRIDSTVDSQVKYDIFERLNTGAIKLEPQELRNAVNRGPFNDLTKKLALNDDFRTILQIDQKEPDTNSKVKKMEDVELVLRFFSVIEGNHLALKSGFKEFLTSELETGNKLTPAALQERAAKFVKTMALIRKQFGDLACAKYRRDGTRASKFNSAVFDAVSAVCAEVAAERKAFTSNSSDRLAQLFANAEFADAVEGSVNDKGKLNSRVNLALQHLTK